MAIPVGVVLYAGGLKFRKNGGKWPFLVLEDYPHRWENGPVPGTNEQSSISTSDGTVVAELAEDAVILLNGYAWDGNSGPAVNTLKCLRASALHDVWCQAMQLDVYERSFRNWRRGAREYRTICHRDGMGWVRRWLRYVALLTYGSFKKMFGRL